jgi:hypothetical protein
MSRFNSACIHLLQVALAIAGFTTVAKFFSIFAWGYRSSVPSFVPSSAAGASNAPGWMASAR